MLLVWALAGIAAPGLAAPRSGPSLASACQLDFQLFCADVDPESPKADVRACLEKNQEVLTEECRAALDPSSVPRPVAPSDGPLARACRDDFRRLCGHSTDRMSFARCVRNHQPQLSDACQDALAAHGHPSKRPPAVGSGRP